MQEGDKKNIENLLKLVKELSVQKELYWFRADLARYFLNDNTKDLKEPPSAGSIPKHPIINNSNESLKKIEHYLSLNGYEIIDYSKIKKQRSRNQLFRDCIEMQKYRLGLINNKINFYEFCRYAHYQVEELFNYYLNISFNNDLKAINNFISSNNEGYTPTSKYANYTSKLWALLNKFGDLYKHKSTLIFINKVRNELSHRDTLSDKEDDEILLDLKSKNIDIKKSLPEELEYILSPNTFELSTEKYSIRTLYWKAKYISKKREQDYPGIIRTLNIVKDTIIANLT